MQTRVSRGSPRKSKSSLQQRATSPVNGRASPVVEQNESWYTLDDFLLKRAGEYAKTSVVLQVFIQVRFINLFLAGQLHTVLYTSVRSKAH